MDKDGAPSLVRRFTLGFALITFSVVGISVGLAYWALVHGLNQEDDAVLFQAAEEAQRHLAVGRSPKREDETRIEAVLIRVIEPGGEVRLESEGMAQLAPRSAFPSGIHHLRLPIQKSLPTGTTFRGVMTHAGDRVIQVAMDRTHEANLLAHHREQLLMILAGATALAAGLGYLLAQRGLRPVSALAEQARHIRPETLGTRLDERAIPVELSTLAKAINAALTRLDEAFERLSGLASDLAHELRTPLHGLKLELEAYARKEAGPKDAGWPLAGALDQLHHLEALVEQMLFLAKTEDPAAILDLQQLNALDALSAAASPFEPWAEEDSVGFHIRVDAALLLKADPTLLRRALHNLLANALRHTPSGGHIHLQAGRTSGGVVIEVNDTGPGIPADQIQRLGERFHRPDPSRSRASGGLGLGLAIVRGIMKLHGGHLELESDPRCGTVARLVFPEV